MDTRYTLAALKAAAEALPPGGSLTLPREALLEALNGNGNSADSSKHETPEQLLTVKEAAARLGVSARYVYTHASQYPFTRRLSPKVLRFSERGIERWLSRTK